MHPTFAQVKAFLEKHPTYGRSYWRNISEVEKQHVAENEYLLVLLKGTYIHKQLQKLGFDRAKVTGLRDRK